MLLHLAVASVLACALAGIPATVTAAPGPTTLLVMDGEPGFAWYWGETQAQSPPDGPMLVEQYTSRSRVVFEFLDEDGSPDTLSFRAPTGQDLAVGTYPGATPGAYADEGQPRMDVHCGHHSDGSFEVREIAWNGGALERLALSFSYTCEGETGGPPGRRYHGELRYQSSVDVAAIKLDPQRVEFPERFVDTSSNAKSITVRNRGTVPLPLTSVVLGGSNPGQFVLAADGCGGKTLAPGASCTLDVIFRPTTGGAKEARIVVDDDATHFGRHWIALAGTARVRTPDAVIDWGSLDWADRHIGTSSAAKTKAVHSRGNVPVDIESVLIGGDDKDSFVLLDDTCSGVRLEVGTSCTVQIRFEPRSPGRLTAELRVRSNDPGSPDTFDLVAWGLREQSATRFGYTRNLGPRLGWNSGLSLATSASSIGRYVHAAWITPVVAGKPVRNTGPYLGVQVARRKVSTSKWTSGSVRVNPKKQHGDRPAVAAADRYVYATWVSIKKPLDYKGWRARTVYVRAASGHGKPGAWKAVKRLSPLKGKVDYPSIAAAGSRVYVAWTNAANGKVKLAMSRDRGQTWSSRTIGMAYGRFGEGQAGYPVVAADGSTVAVAWLRHAGEVVTRLSTNGGASFWSTKVLTGPKASARVSRLGVVDGKASRVQGIGGRFRVAADTDLASSVPSIAVRGGRVAVAWSTGDRLKVRTWRPGGWSPVVSAYGNAERDDNIDYIYSPAVALQGTAAVGVAYSVARTGGAQSRMMWSESSDDGQHWYHRKLIGDVRYEDRIFNEWPSVTWPLASKRVVAWNAAGQDTFRLRVREGTGQP